MKNIFRAIFIWLLVVFGFVAVFYFFRANIFEFKQVVYQKYLPCREPIAYTIGEFDTRFGISQKNFLAATADAEEIWEKPFGRNLFEYVPSSSLKINLIYDFRQDATVKLRELGIVVKDDRETYDRLQIQYTSLDKTYLADKAEYEKKAAEIDRRTVAYNESAASLKRGRKDVTREEVDQLNAEGEAINKLIDEIRIVQENLNKKVDELNALGETLNRLAATLNITAEKYNTIGLSRGREFEEGTYISSEEGREINIYQYDNLTKLIRVLAHEFGHALDLPHVSSTKAIMYYLNNGINKELMPEDLAILKEHCNME